MEKAIRLASACSSTAVTARINRDLQRRRPRVAQEAKHTTRTNSEERKAPRRTLHSHGGFYLHNPLSTQRQESTSVGKHRSPHRSQVGLVKRCSADEAKRTPGNGRRKGLVIRGRSLRQAASRGCGRRASSGNNFDEREVFVNKAKIKSAKGGDGGSGRGNLGDERRKRVRWTGRRRERGRNRPTTRTEGASVESLTGHTAVRHGNTKKVDFATTSSEWPDHNRTYETQDEATWVRRMRGHRRDPARKGTKSTASEYGWKEKSTASSWRSHHSTGHQCKKETRHGSKEAMPERKCQTKSKLYGPGENSGAAAETRKKSLGAPDRAKDK